MVSLSNIHALDHFKRNSAGFRRRLRKSGQPEVLTVDGRAELVVQSADSYQKLLDRLEELETLAALREGLADAKAGRTKPIGRVFAELRRRFDLPGRRTRARKSGKA